MSEELHARLKAGIEAANQGRTKDLGDFTQYAEEPAWRAELLEALESAVEHWYHSTDGDLLDALQPHIQAAEQRGREAALREAAERIRTELPETVKESLGGGIWTITTVPTARQAADLIDPDKP